jgi:hypothetical protein
MLFWGIWAPSNGPKKVYDGPQVGRMHGPISWLENKALTKSKDSFCRRNGPKQPEIVFFILFWGIWAMGTPKWTEKVIKGGWDVWPNVLA